MMLQQTLKTMLHVHLCSQTTNVTCTSVFTDYKIQTAHGESAVIRPTLKTMLQFQFMFAACLSVRRKSPKVDFE